ncbi:MAG: hypothetical protein FWF76_01500 [Oscillospiraceae bacterium]|nr:hypothetical protein [Oscillospiraceae bacterium]
MCRERFQDNIGCGCNGSGCSDCGSNECNDRGCGCNGRGNDACSGIRKAKKGAHEVARGLDEINSGICQIEKELSKPRVQCVTIDPLCPSCR